MNNFIDLLKNEENKSYKTENLAVTFGSSNSAIVDLFYYIGATRSNKIQDDYFSLLTRAFNEDPNTTLAIILYARSIRPITDDNLIGLGERNIARVSIEYLLKNGFLVNYKTDVLLKSLVQVGRWDDIFYSEYMLYTSLPIIKDVINRYKENNISYNELNMFKWLPSINASSKKTVKLANTLRKELKLSPKEYRKLLAKARTELCIVEKFMSFNLWGDIDYSKVPSKAMLKYKNAFLKHDDKRFSQYIKDVNSGKKKINTKTVFPYEIFKKIRDLAKDDFYSYKDNRLEQLEMLETMWKNLPNYLNEEFPVLVVADTSGSMYNSWTSVIPIDISLSLALYCAERNLHPEFRNRFITFSRKPTFHEIVGKNLLEKFKSMQTANWEMNTDIQAVFDLILRTAINNNISNSQLPKAILIISDMEFDYCAENKTNFEVIKEKFDKAGYSLPIIIFWSVDARINNIPVLRSESNTILLSGYSSSVFSALISMLKNPENINPEKYIYNTLKQLINYVDLCVKK